MLLRIRHKKKYTEKKNAYFIRERKKWDFTVNLRNLSVLQLKILTALSVKVLIILILTKKYTKVEYITT